MVLGDNGIIGQAQMASQKQKYEEKEEEQEVEYVAGQEINYYVEKSNEASSKDGETIYASLGEAINENVDDGIKSINDDTKDVKLQKKVYMDENIEVKENETLTIDLNGQELIFVRKFEAEDVNDNYPIVIAETGKLNIKDTSEKKTGKIRYIIEDIDISNYNKKYDFNNDGLLCYEDVEYIWNLSKKGDAGYEEKCDLDEDGVVTPADVATAYSECKKVKMRHLIRRNNNNRLELDIDEANIITPCGHYYNYNE